MAIGTTAALLGGSVLSPIVGGLVGNALSSGDREQAKRLQAEALQRILGVNAPSVEELIPLLDTESQSAGQLTPEMVELVKQQDSELGNIQVDPRLREAQLQSLMKLQQIGAEGLRPEDKAMLAQIQQQTAQDERAREESILQNMQARGIGGAGSELASRLAASQGAANRASSQGLDIAGQASQRALQAIMNAGTLSGQMENTQFGQESQKATAQDLINAYNARNAQNIAGVNVGAKNAAQAANLSQQQALLNRAQDLRNQQAIAKAQGAQAGYSNKLGQASAAAGAQQGAANQALQSAGQTQQTLGGLGQAIGTGLAGAANYNQNQDYLDYLKNKKA